MTFTGITKTKAGELVGLRPNRFGEKVTNGTLTLRDFLVIAREAGGAEFLRLLADEIEAGASEGLPCEAVYKASEERLQMQAEYRSAVSDGVITAHEKISLEDRAAHVHALSAKIYRAIRKIRPGPIRQLGAG